MIDNNIIEIEVKSNYGNKAIYPVNETGKLFLKLTNRKTFTDNDIKVLQKLGYVVFQVTNNPYSFKTI